MNRSLKVGCVLLLIGVVVFTVGCGKQKQTSKTETETKPAAEKLATTDVFGEVKVKQERNIRLNLDARVTKIHVEAGDRVQQGDKLITLDLSKVQDKVAQKQNSLAVAKNKLEQIKQGGEVKLKQLKNKLQAEQKLYQAEQEELTQKREELATESSPDLKKLASKLKAEEKLYQQQQEELAQKKQLLTKEAISQHEFDQFKKSVDKHQQVVDNIKLSIAETKYNKQQEIKTLTNSLISRKQTIEDLKLKIQQQQQDQQQDYLAQEAKVEELTAEINQLEAQLNRSYLQDNHIVADINQGIISEIGYKEGDLVTKEQKLLTILNLNQVVVKADVPEEFIADVQLGAQATIIPLADKNKEYQGEVIKIADLAVERGGETVIPVEISINNQDKFLRPNFNVDVAIEK